MQKIVRPPRQDIWAPLASILAGWQHLRQTNCLHTAVYFGYPSNASLNGCRERPQAGSDRLQTIHHSGTITMSGRRAKGARTHTPTHAQAHCGTALVLHTNSSSTISSHSCNFKEEEHQQLISWHTSPKINPPAGKDPPLRPHPTLDKLLK